MIFADDETANNPASLKFLEHAHAWRLKQAEMASAAGEDGSDDEESDEEDEDDAAAAE